MKRYISTSGCVITGIMILAFLLGCGSAPLENGNNNNGQADKFTVFTVQDGIADNSITDIAVDYARKGVWCSTLNGISFYSTTDSTWTTFGAEYDIPSMEVNSITIDYFTTTVWAGTTNGPASLSDSLWHAFSDMDSLVHRYVNVIACMTDGSRWFGTKVGLSRYSSNSWTSFTTASGLSGDDITSITSGPTGDIWVGTTNGISINNGAIWTRVLPSVYVLVIYKTYDGTMWCGTANGIAAFKDNSWKIYGTADGVPAPGINDFDEDSAKTLWVATDGGVAKFNGDKWEKLDLPELVASVKINDIEIDISSGIIWIGTENGIVMYQPANM